MDDKDNKNDFGQEELKKFRAERTVTKLTAIRALKKLKKEGSKWTLIQEIMQEIIATYTIKDPNKRPSVRVLAEELRAEVNKRYKQDEELRVLLLEAIPQDASISEGWFRKEGWEQAVWSKVRDCGLFSKERRAQMVNALYDRGLNKSDNAAKLWLTLSGDYSEKGQESDKNKTLDIYREINEILHKKTDNNNS